MCVCVRDRDSVCVCVCVSVCAGSVSSTARQFVPFPGFCEAEWAGCVERDW